MIGTIRARLGERAALKAVRNRRAQPLTASVHARTLLVVMPHEEEKRQTAWAFLQSLPVEVSHMVPVLTEGEGLTTVPDAFAAREVRIGSGETRWNGLPKPSVADALWGDLPDLALSFREGDDLLGRFLVGASPAAFRVGLHARKAEPFFDLMIQPGTDFRETLETMRHALGQIRPQLLPV